MHRLKRLLREEKPTPLSRQTAYLSRIARLMQGLERNLVVMDIGCRWGVASVWAALGKGVTIVGFDPDPAECERLKLAYTGPCNVRFVPTALGSFHGKTSIFLTAEPACSSLYRPDPTLTRSMPELSCAKHTGEAEVAVTTLDLWASSAGITQVDFLKVDAQGAELEILRGGQDMLRSVRAIEVEVEFNPIYLGQPLFSDVDSFLRSHGFVLWRLTNLAHYSRLPQRSTVAVDDVQYFDSRVVPVSAQGGQLYWGHAYYVRPDMVAAAVGTDWRGRLRDAAIIAGIGFYDLSESLLEQVRNGAPDDIRRLIAV